MWPTLSLGMIFNSDPYFKNTFPQVWSGFMPIPFVVIIPHVYGFCSNNPHTCLIHIEKGVVSGTETVLNGAFGSEAKMNFKVILLLFIIII